MQNPLEPSFDFDLVLPAVMATTHRQVIASIAKNIAPLIGVSVRILTERLIDLEKNQLGTQGQGVLVQHLRISGLKEDTLAFVRLLKPVNIAAADDTHVDMICVLLTPQRDGSLYLQTLSRLARFFKNSQIVAQLRAAPDETALRMVLDRSASRLAA